MRPTLSSTGLRAVAALSAVVSVSLAATGTLALEAANGDEAAIKACEQRICSMALTKKPAGEDLTCALSKTWDKDTLKKGESNNVKWGFGDARCSVNLDVKRADVIQALTKKEHTVEIPSHTVNCTVERDGEPKPVVAKLAPKLVFKDGKADKIWINLTDIDGPANVKATVWMAAKLEDSLGIFHKSMIKSTNKFLYQKCAQRYFADGRPKPDPKEKAKAAAAAKSAAAKAAGASKPEAADGKPSATAAAAKPAEPSLKKPAEAAGPAGAKPADAPKAADNK